MRRFTSLAVLSAVAIAGATAVSVAPVSSGVVASDDTEVFEYTGDVQDFEVPADVCSLTIEAWGAAGGGANAAADSEADVYNDVSEEEPPPLTKGGYAKATIAVTPGETLHVTVGGAGGDGELPPLPTGTFTQTVQAADGGWPDGGAGGLGVAQAIAPDLSGAPSVFASAYAAAASGGGGGSSDVRRGGSDLTDRVVVAGGGGGLGAAATGWGFAVADTYLDEVASLDEGEHADTETELAGAGDGGGLTGGDGQTVAFGSGFGVVIDQVFEEVLAAFGGTQTAGGAGFQDGALGAGGDGGADAHNASRWGGVGFAATATGLVFAEATAAAAAGGGGGGGYFGGGGGNAAVETTAVPTLVPVDVEPAVDPDIGVTAASSAGGGGGGSGYGPEGTEFDTGVREGNGSVVLSWTVDPGCGAVSPDDVVVTPIRFTG